MLFLASLLALHLAPVTPSAPNRQPQLAAAGDTVAIVFGAADTIWMSRSADHGRSFATPAKVAQLPKLMLGRHRGPRVAMIGETILVSAIASEPGDLMVWRSSDSGRTWSAPAVVNDVPKAAREGLHALAADREGHVALAWLDDRGGNGKRLFGAFSDDAGKTWSRNVMLYASPERTICECCHPSLVAMGNGEFGVMWRNALAGSRDLYAMRIRHGAPAGEVVKQGTGTWKLDACPMDGGGLVARDGKLSSAWRREHDVYVAEPGKPELKLGAGQDIALASNARGLYAVWSTPDGIQLHDPSGTTKLSGTGAFPAILALPDGAILAAWEENGAISIARF